MLITTNLGELLLIQWMLKSTSTPEDMVLHIYKNNYTPVAGSVLADFTQADFTNYSTQAISRATWGAPTSVSGVAQSVYGGTFTWTCGATTNTVYGVYITGSVSTSTVIFAQRFDSPRLLTNGTVLTVSAPTFTLDSAN